jgi:TraM recognition site of TraD and TraG
MSLFYPDPPSQTKKADNEITPQAAFGIICAVLALLGYNKRAPVFQFYFRNFETIYLAAYFFIAVLSALGIWQLKKKTKAVSRRMNLLSWLLRYETGIFVGKTRDGISLNLPRSARLEHVQIIGSTGRGKTKSVILPWLCRDIVSRCSAVLIDGKGDPEFFEIIREVADGVPGGPEVIAFDLGNPLTSCAMNPLNHGSPQQITDRLFQAFQFSDVYYKSVQYSITSAVIQLIQEVGGENGGPGVVTFRRLYELLSSEQNLTAVLAKSKNKATRPLFAQFLSTPKDQREQRLSGLLSQITPFAIGEIATLVNEEGDRESCTVSEILLSENTRPKVFIILIPTLKYQEIGHQLGKLICQELAWAVGERASRIGKNAPFTPVFLDEFSAFVYPGFSNILNKARSSQVALHLSHQSLGDLSIVSDDFAKIVTTNTNVKCILGLNDPETADWFAKHLGTETSEKNTERAENGGFLSGTRRTGELSIREVEAYKVHPNNLKNYTAGQGVLHLPSPNGNITEEVNFVPFSSAELPDLDS